MATNTIRTMEVFAETIKSALEACLGEGVRVTVQKVTKNNGISIESNNLRPSQKVSVLFIIIML